MKNPILASLLILSALFFAGCSTTPADDEESIEGGWSVVGLEGNYYWFITPTSLSEYVQLSGGCWNQVRVLAFNGIVDSEYSFGGDAFSNGIRISGDADRVEWQFANSTLGAWATPITTKESDLSRCTSSQL